MKRHGGPAAAAMVGLIRLYQLTLSALIGRRCRYLPTCSDYAMEAITRHGPSRGSWLAAKRFCRCHPWGGEGFDPVPGSCREAGGPGAAGGDLTHPSGRG